MKNTIKIFFTIFVLLLQYSSIKAEWPAVYTGQFWPNSQNVANAIAVDNAGNCYVTGLSQNYPPGEVNYFSFTTVKFNSSGEQLWEKIIYEKTGYGQGNSIVYDPIHDWIYVTGRYSISGTTTFASLITVAYNCSDGQMVWFDQYDTDYDDWGNHIECDANHVYVTGVRNFTQYHSEFLTIKYNSSNGTRSATWPPIVGGELGVRIYSYYGIDIPHSLKVNPNNGDVYVTGESLNYRNNKDFMTIKYSSNGDVQWISRYDNEEDDYAADMAVFPSHAVYVTGTSTVSGVLKMTTIKYDVNEGQMVWVMNDQPGISNSIGLYQRWFGRGWNTFTVDVFVTGYNGNNGQTIRYSNYGEQEWLTTFQGQNPSRFNFLKIDTYENVFVAGYTGFGEAKDYLTVKYNSEGFQQGEEETLHLLDDQFINGMALDANGNVFVSGPSIQRSTPQWGVYLTMKYPANGDVDNFSNSNNDLNNIPEKFSLGQNYPNPFNPSANIQYAIPQNGNVLLKVYDMLGREVAVLVNEYKNAGYYDVSFDGSKLSSGVYIYKLQAGQYSDMKKMVLIK